MPEGILVGVIGVIVLIAAFLVGGITGVSDVGRECRMLGKANIHGTVYVCTEEKK